MFNIVLAPGHTTAADVMLRTAGAFGIQVQLFAGHTTSADVTLRGLPFFVSAVAAGGGGADVEVTLVGVSSAAAIGSVTVTADANTTLTGVASAGAIGTITVTAAANVEIAGVSSATAIGAVTVTAGADTSITGVSSACAIGSVSVTASANVSITGVSSACAIGTVDVTTSGGVNVDVAGVSFASSIGTVSVTTGSTSSAGMVYGYWNAVRVSERVEVVGVSARCRIGSVKVAIKPARAVHGKAKAKPLPVPALTGKCLVSAHGGALTSSLRSECSAGNVGVVALRDFSDEELAMIAA